jgi:hypothetical protein
VIEPFLDKLPGGERCAFERLKRRINIEGVNGFILEDPRDCTR